MTEATEFKKKFKTLEDRDNFLSKTTLRGARLNGLIVTYRELVKSEKELEAEKKDKKEKKAKMKAELKKEIEAELKAGK